MCTLVMAPYVYVYILVNSYHPLVFVVFGVITCAIPNSEHIGNVFEPSSHSFWLCNIAVNIDCLYIVVVFYVSFFYRYKRDYLGASSDFED